MMRCCCRERKPGERGSVRRLPAAPHCCLSIAQTSVYTDLATISSIHPSACVTRERAAAPPPPQCCLLGSTDLRLHRSCTGLVNVRACQGQQSSGARATREVGLSCPPNAHAE